MRPRTYPELQDAAATDVATEIASATAPYQAERARAEARRKQAATEIGAMFGAIQPFVAQSAQAVQDYYTQGQDQMRGIFDRAQQRMQGMRADRGAEAQALAQEMGGPVSVGEFTAPLESSGQALTDAEGGGMLHALASAQAGAQEAQNFAGEVFPALRTEETANRDRFFQEQIREAENQVASLESQKGPKTTARLNELLGAERSFGLDKLKSDRDWQATLRTLKNDEERMRMAQALDEAGVTGTFKGQDTLASRQLSADERNAAAQLGLSQEELALRREEYISNAAIQRQQLNVSQRQGGMQMLDSLITGGGGKSVKTTVKHEIGADRANGPNAPKNVYAEVDRKGKTHYYFNETVTVSAGGTTPIGSPGQLLSLLTATGIPRKMAINLIRARLNLPGWTPGKPKGGKKKPKGKNPNKRGS